MNCSLFIVAVVLITTTFGSDSKFKDSCGLYRYVEEKCCKTQGKKGYKLNIGVCEMEIKDRRQIVGFRSKPDRNVTRDEAMSDSHASEDYPGKDEGQCHVYRTNLNGGACVPGNIVHAVESASEWIVSLELADAKCSFNLGQDCNGAIDENEQYDFAVKLSSSLDLTTLQSSLSTTPLEDYGCGIENIKFHGHEHLFLVCPL
ncbi:hypothetical protein ACHWQZ_G002595 [Mnemiopsis leidyi]